MTSSQWRSTPPPPRESCRRSQPATSFATSEPAPSLRRPVRRERSPPARSRSRATRLKRVHADFSSVGPTPISLRLKPDVAAPGVDVLSSVPGGWASFSGTSMAAPHVAGAAALLVQRHPDWTVAQVKSALVQTGVDATGEGSERLPPTFQGGGVIALARADRPSSLRSRARCRSASSTARISLRIESSSFATPAAARGRGAVSLEQLRSAPSFSVDLARSEVSVPGDLTLKIRTAGPPREGEVSGYIVLRRGDDVRRVPYWGRRTAQRLSRHRVIGLARPGIYRGTTVGQPALVSCYRYPESPRGIGVTTVLRGPELVYRFVLARRVANFGVVVTSRAAGARVEPRAVAALDENRLTGSAGLPVSHNPYLEGFHASVPAAGALSPQPGEYEFVFDSATRAGAGRFAFRFWVNDVTPPTLRVATRVVRAGARCACSRPTPARASTRRRSSRRSTAIAPRRRSEVASSRSRRGGLTPGTHRVRLRVSDYQETKNTENVARILPNTRTLSTTFTIR